MNWNTLSPANRLRVPIGKALDGRLVHLDIKEGAEDGFGPPRLDGWTDRLG